MFKLCSKLRKLQLNRHDFGGERNEKRRADPLEKGVSYFFAIAKKFLIAVKQLTFFFGLEKDTRVGLVNIACIQK